MSSDCKRTARLIGILIVVVGVRHLACDRAEYVVDEPPANEDDEAALLVTAHYVIETLAGALEATAVRGGV